MSASNEASRILISGPDYALEILSAELFDAGVGGLVEEAGAIVVYPNDEEEKARFLTLIAEFKKRLADPSRSESVEATVEAVDPGWQKTWQQALRPEKISRSFTLRPTHCPIEETTLEKSSLEKGAVHEQTIWFEPDASFGSGGHPTTQLAATWVEEYVSSQPDIACLDVGTGTGVLSLVAVRCGARSVLAVDIDEVAVRSAKKNCALNGASDSIMIELGSADATSATFDLVIANINTPILLALARELCPRVDAKGKLLLTGLLVEDIPEIEEAFERHQLHVAERETNGDWALLILTR